MRFFYEPEQNDPASVVAQTLLLLLFRFKQRRRQRRRKIEHGRNAKERYIACRIPAAVKILSEKNIEVKPVAESIFDAGCELSHQVFFCMKNKANAGGKRIGEFALLKHVEVGP